ncbi:MAG: uroporphyrinogen-III synthase [Silicimonas sp.]|nr:uroporphyrinogen-III synthase [Silicimonas sp.]
MPVNESTLLLTRPEAQSREFLLRCETLAGRKLPAVISPLMRIEPIGDTPDLGRYATVIFTSGNAVRSVLRHQSLKGRAVATVGQSTAKLAKSAGADAQALGEDVEAFARNAERLKGPSLFCRGVHSRGDLAEKLRDQNHSVEEAVVYDQVATPLSDQARQLLAGSRRVIAPVFSPRTARLLAAQGPLVAPLTIVAMSQAVAAELELPGEVVVARAPESQRMAELVVSLLLP